MTYTEAVEMYLEARCVGAAASTVGNHRRIARHLADWAGRELAIEEVADDGTLGRFAAARLAQVAQNTVNSEGSSLLAVCNWAAKKGWCDHVDWSPPGRIQRAPRGLDVPELVALLNAAQRCTGTLCGVRADVRMFALVKLAIATAERRKAIASLEWASFDTSGARPVVTFRAETRKGGRIETVHRLPRSVIESLAELREHTPEREPPFAWLLSGSFYHGWHAVRMLAQLDDWVTPHKLRAAAATHCATLEQAQELLGHVSSRVTARHYRDVSKVPDPTGLAAALAKPRRRSLLERLGWAG